MSSVLLFCFLCYYFLYGQCQSAGKYWNHDKFEEGKLTEIPQTFVNIYGLDYWFNKPIFFIQKLCWITGKL